MLNRKPPVFLKWSTLKNLEIPEPEYIITGMIKGEIGMIQAVTNIGKTTLALNICICLATGRTFGPIVKPGPPRKILYLDYETQLSASRADLRKMESVLTEAEKVLLADNFTIFNARNTDGGDLKLTDEKNLKLVAELVLAERIDLLVIDPLSLAFSGVDEQSNTAVEEKLISPLLDLSSACGVSILTAHHIGKEKGEDGGQRIGVHRSRGSSNFGGLNRVLIQLERKYEDGKALTRLSYEKIKGEEPDPVILSLDPEIRWFEVIHELAPQREETTVDKIKEMIREFGGQAKRAELVLKGRLSTSTLDRCLRIGVRDGVLTKSGEHGVYSVVEDAIDVSGEESVA